MEIILSNKKINSCHLSDLSIDSKNCICLFDKYWVLKSLYIWKIRELYDMIASSHSGK